MIVKFKDGTKREIAGLRNADLRNADLRNADLRNADLRNADLSNADLSNADLSNADLSNADLRNADLDFSCFPLWCGSFDMKTDIEFVKQILYHVSRLDFDDTEGIKDAIREFANTASVKQRHKLPNL
jgi:hypothetical protein